MADADVVSIGRRQVDAGQVDAGQIDAGQSDEGQIDAGRADESDHDKGRPVAEPLLRSVVGDLLRRERSAQERTLSDVADAAQVSKPYLSEVERGRKEPSSEVLGAICRSLGISLGDLVGRAHRELVSRATPLVHQELVSPAAPQRPSHPSGPVLLAA